MFSPAPTAPHLLGGTATPPSYLSYSFDLPERRYVGLLACQRDPLLTELETRVLRCDKRVRDQPPAAAKGGKNKVKAANASQAKPVVEQPEEEWEVELEDTVLFPEGGGQDPDQGWLVPKTSEGALDESATVTVRDVQRRNLDAVHYVSKPVTVGSTVLVKLDVDRRRDLMCQHTGQHLLSAVIEQDLGLDTLAWSLTKAPEMCYIELARAPTPEEISRIQQRCTDAIRRGHAVRVNMHLAGENGVELGAKVPTDYVDADGSTVRKPVMRTVVIEDMDENPCCGTHFPTLAMLESLFVSPFTTPIRGTNARLYFCVGPRVLSMLASSHQIVKSATTEMGCAPTELVERLSTLKTSSTDSVRKEKRLREELAGFVAEDLWRTSTEQAGESGIVGQVLFREDDATNSIEFLSTVSMALKPKVESLAEGKKHLFVLASACTPGNVAPSGGALLITGSDDLVTKAGKLVTAKFEGRIRGGGKGRWQGKLSGDRWAKTDAQLLREIADEASQ